MLEAILIKSKTYNHVSGIQVVPRGTVIKVVPSAQADSMSVDGDSTESPSAFYGLHNGELFDIDPSDFRAVN